MANKFMGQTSSMPRVSPPGGGQVMPGHPAEVVPLPDGVRPAVGSPLDGMACGFMSKFQVHFPQTGNDNPARRITSADHRDAQGWVWRLVLHPWGHEERGCYSVFLELANSHDLSKDYSRYVRLEFAMHAWDVAFQMEPVKTRFLLHKFCDQATDFGYGRAFEHDLVMARRQTFIDPQGFVRISVRIVDVQEAFFRVATDADLSRSITGGGGGGDFADWMRCLPAKSFRHDQLLFVIQKVAELTGVPLVSCRPWLCMPRPGGAIRPVAPLMPQHLKMTINEALGDREQYHLYLEEVDSLPEVWERRRTMAGVIPTDEAISLLLSGRAYAQLPHEVHLVFLKIDRRILAAHARGSSVGNELALNPSEEAEFMFIGKAMAHKSDRASELVPIARSLAHLPDNIPLEVFEQLGPDEVRRFSSDTTVEQANLTHGSVLLFRGVHAQAKPWKLPSVPLPSASAIVCFNPAAAAAAAAAAAIARVSVPGSIAGNTTICSSSSVPSCSAVPSKNSAAGAAAAAAAVAAVVAAGVSQPLPIPATPVDNGLSGIMKPALTSSVSPSPSPPHGGEEAPAVSADGGGGERKCDDVQAKGKDDIAGGLEISQKNGGAAMLTAGWNRTIAGAAAAAAAAAAGVPSPVMMMDGEAQRRATCLALYQVQEDARQRAAAAKQTAKKIAEEASEAAAKNQAENKVRAKDEINIRPNTIPYTKPATLVLAPALPLPSRTPEVMAVAPGAVGSSGVAGSSSASVASPMEQAPHPQQQQVQQVQQAPKAPHAQQVPLALHLPSAESIPKPVTVVPAFTPGKQRANIPISPAVKSMPLTPLQALPRAATGMITIPGSTLARSNMATEAVTTGTAANASAALDGRLGSAALTSLSMNGITAASAALRAMSNAGPSVATSGPTPTLAEPAESQRHAQTLSDSTESDKDADVDVGAYGSSVNPTSDAESAAGGDNNLSSAATSKTCASQVEISSEQNATRVIEASSAAAGATMEAMVMEKQGADSRDVREVAAASHTDIKIELVSTKVVGGGPSSGVVSAVSAAAAAGRPPRPSRTTRAARALEGHSTAPTTSPSSSCSSSSSFSASVSIPNVCEQQRRSCRKASAVAVQQMRSCVRGGTRGGSGAGTGSSAECNGAISGSAAASLSTTSACGGAHSVGGPAVAAANGVGEAGGQEARAAENGSAKRSSVDGPNESQGPRKHPRSSSTGKDEADSPIEPRLYFSTSEYTAFVANIKQVSGATADKVKSCLLAMGSSEITKAISNAGNGAEDAWKIPLFNRLIAAVEREAGRIQQQHDESEQIDGSQEATSSN